MFLYASDLHLDGRSDSLASLQLLLQLAQSFSCPLVLGGDIFDSKLISSETASMAVSIVSKYNIPIFYIKGNHDNVEPHWAGILFNATSLNGKMVDISGDVVTGIDFHLPAEFPDSLSGLYSGIDVLVCHQTFSCFNPAPYTVSKDSVSAINLTLAGDYHVPLEYAFPDTGNTILSAGATNRRSIAEPAPGAILIRQAKSRQFETIQLPHRRMVILDIESTEAAVTERLAAASTHTQCLLAGNAYPCEFPATLEKTLLVFRGTIDRERREAWLHSKFAVDNLIRFVPIVNKDEKESPSIVQYSGSVRGSYQYLRDVLQSYPTSDKVRQLTSDYLFSDADAFLDTAYHKFENVQ